MAYKDVKEYYDKISKQYKDLVEELQDFTKEAEEGLVPPEILEQAKKTIEPLKKNYERWSYMMYLWKMPNKKNKKEKYKKQQKLNISDENKIETVLKENNDALENLRKR